MHIRELNAALEAQRKDVQLILNQIKDKALAGATQVLISGSSLNIYRLNKLQQLGYSIEKYDDELFRIWGWE